MSDDDVFVAKGWGATLEVRKSSVAIRRHKGLVGIATDPLAIGGEKEIPLSQISAVQFKKAGPLVNGFIQFSFIGGSEHQSGGLLGAFLGSDDHQSENAVPFTMKQNSQFERAKELIDQRRAAASGGATVGSGLDELEKLARLRDQGIVTEEEFEAKKKKLLDL